MKHFYTVPKHSFFFFKAKIRKKTNIFRVQCGRKKKLKSQDISQKRLRLGLNPPGLESRVPLIEEKTGCVSQRPGRLAVPGRRSLLQEWVVGNPSC